MKKQPALYVGTYQKYNNGSLFGKWLQIGDYETYQDFITACKELHGDEKDPELMFQDFEDFPENLYSECFINEERFDILKQFADLDENLQEAVEAYLALGGENIENALDNYLGEYDEGEYAEEIFEDYYPDIPTNLIYYIDFKAMERDMELNGDISTFNGHYFSN